MQNLQATGFNSLRNNSSNSIAVSSPRVANSIFLASVVRKLHKLSYKLGVGITLDRYQGRLIFYNSKKDKNHYKSHKDKGLYLNIGAGAFKHPYWINIDYKGQTKYYQALQGKEGIDYINLNLCLEDIRLPFSDNSVDLIYCSHTLEHLQEHNGIHLLKECQRILKTGGTLRLVLPDIKADFEIARIIYTQIGLNDAEVHKLLRKVTLHMLSSTDALDIDRLASILKESDFNPEKCYSRFSSLCDLNFRPDKPDRHISYWSHDRLSELTATLGFEIYIPFYRGSSSALPFKNIDLFDTTEAHISIYGEYIK